MHTHQYKKIDLQSDYPCPACRRGRLLPITLTEALGCDRCQQIFVLNDSGYILEGLATSYPYPKKWFWTGRQWSVKRPHQGWGHMFPPLITMLFFSIGVGLFAIIATFFDEVLPPIFKWGIILGALAVMMITFWIVFRR